MTAELPPASSLPLVDHVALLTPDVAAAAARVAGLGLPLGEEEAFPGEGTRERYAGEEGRPGRLLLMQPLGEEGPYARALARRGPGLHHVALCVSDVRSFVSGVRGWLLHPRSLESLEASGVAWLARPGVPFLVEVGAGPGPNGSPAVARVEVPVAPDLAPLLGALGGVVAPSADEAHLTIAGRRLPVDDLVGR